MAATSSGLSPSVVPRSLSALASSSARTAGWCPRAAAQHIAVAPTTLPSHTSLMTGLYPRSHGTPRNGFVVGDDLSVEDGRVAARMCALNLIAQVKAACGGDLDRVKRVVRLGGPRSTRIVTAELLRSVMLLDPEPATA